MYGDVLGRVEELATKRSPGANGAGSAATPEPLPASLGEAHELIGHLHVALIHQRTICHAVGRLMERYGLTDEAALEALRRVSQNENVKLYDLAVQIVAEGTSHGL